VKKSWTRLSSLVLKAGGHTRFMEARFNNLFMRHHRNACEIILDRTGEVMAAVYFTPKGKHPDFLRGFMKALRERVNGESTHPIRGQGAKDE
jgi:hypothetical protein